MGINLYCYFFLLGNEPLKLRADKARQRSEAFREQEAIVRMREGVETILEDRVLRRGLTCRSCWSQRREEDQTASRVMRLVKFTSVTSYLVRNR